MLKLRVWTTEYQKKSPCVLLLGGFDGLHAGHKKLVEKAKSFGLPIGIMSIVGGKEGEALFTLSEREKSFQNAGAQFCFSMPFEKIKDMQAEEFLFALLQEFQVQAFVCGDDFRFGKGALGTPDFIKQATQVCVETLPLVMEDGKKISSSQIKAFVQQGEIQKANRLLGERFFLQGEVVQDRQIGRKLGFPTANIFYPKDKYPLKIGVYETRVCINGTQYNGITNYGSRPTFDNQTVLTETFLDGFSGDLYNQTLTVEFVRFLRDIQKFNGEESLKKQLEEDLRRVREND